MSDGRGRAAIVTGAASGIGRAAALRLARDGWAVALGDANGEAVERTAREIATGGGRAIALATDVADEESVRALIAESAARHGPLRAVIHSAGVHQAGKATHDLALDDWSRVIAINLTGSFLVVKHAGAAMVEQGDGGAIVCLSSAAAAIGLFNSAEYCASKAGVTGLVRAAAIDFAEHRIRVNALLPGATDTPLAHSSSAMNPKLAGTLRVPLGRFASAEEMAGIAVWLVSDEAAYITAASISADGGMTAA